MNTETKFEEWKNWWITIPFAFIIVYVTFVYARDQVLLGSMNDYASHIKSLLPLFRTEWWKGFMAAPHCLWHLTVLFFYGILKLPLEAAAGYASSVYALFYYLVLLWMIQKVTAYAGAKENPVRANLLATGFYFVQSIYFYWLDAGERYLGSFSMNPIHNPTQMGVRGFAVLCFALVIDLLGTWSKEDYKPLFFRIKGKKSYLLLSVLLFLSTVMKPTFTEVFVPAVALYMLCVWIYKLMKKSQPGVYFKKCLLMLLIAVPSLIFVLIQFVLFFAMGGSYGAEEGMIITKWLEVWELFTDNVFLSVLLGMAFPIYMLIIDADYFLRSRMGQIAWLSYGIGFLEAALLGEDGNRLSHANFIWPLMSGMLLVWLVSFLRLLSLERKTLDTRAKQIMVTAAWCIFAAHVLCGFLFLDLSLKGL